MDAWEHAFRWAVSNQRERKVNCTVGLCSEGGCISICLVVHQFNSGWRARDDLPCKSNHHVEGVGVGDRACDENVRSVAVPFVGRRSAIHCCGEGDVGEGWTGGLVGLVGFILFGDNGCFKGSTDHHIGCVKLWIGLVEVEVEQSIVGTRACDFKEVAPNFGGTVADFCSISIHCCPRNLHIGEQTLLERREGVNGYKCFKRAIVGERNQGIWSQNGLSRPEGIVSLLCSRQRLCHFITLVTSIGDFQCHWSKGINGSDIC